MTQDYKALLRLLYDEFGDDLKDLGKEVLVNKLTNIQQGKASPGGSAAIDTSFEKQDTIADEINSAATTQDEDISEASFTNEDVDGQFDYYSAEIFEQQALGKLQSEAIAVMDSADVAAAVKELILMAGEVRKFEEAQITVRTDISARRDIALANIEAQKAALLLYLDKSFDERKESFQMFFNVIDHALENDNMQELAMGLDSVIKLAESSPFKDLHSLEATASALTDTDHEWDF